MSKYVPPHKKNMASDPGATDYHDTPRTGWNNGVDNPFNRSFNGRFDRSERSEHSDREYGRSDRDYGRYGRAERVERADRGERVERADRGERNPLASEEFPSLSKPKLVRAVTDAAQVTQAAQVQVTNRPTFAQLASEWTKKVQEQQAKEAAEAKALEEDLKRVRELKEKEERDRLKALSMGLSSVNVNKKHDSDDDKEFDIGCHVSHGSDESYQSYDEQVCEEEDEEEEEEDEDAYWENRRNKNELSTF